MSHGGIGLKIQSGRLKISTLNGFKVIFSDGLFIYVKPLKAV
ncbi:hypothetical protein l13_00440 [Neisseria weaveri ATCC 51223]|nr:hypothetical protein l13_00440 [Neisseria weaveri ATCC 51223]